jgi:hypothetical protein
MILTLDLGTRTGWALWDAVQLLRHRWLDRCGRGDPQRPMLRSSSRLA